MTPTVYSFVSFIYLMTFLAAQFCIGVVGSVYYHDITVVHGAAAPFFYKVLYYTQLTTTFYAYVYSVIQARCPTTSIVAV
jgi:hypothetical protein